MKNGRIRTYPIKSLTIFLIVCFVVSVGMIVLFAMPFMQNELWVIKILVWVFCGLFAVASGIVLVNQTMFYISVDSEYFCKYIFLFKKKIKLKDIQRIKNQEGFYVVYHENKKFATFASNTKESQEIIVFLERNGVRVDW